MNPFYPLKAHLNVDSLAEIHYQIFYQKCTLYKNLFSCRKKTENKLNLHLRFFQLIYQKLFIKSISESKLSVSRISFFLILIIAENNITEYGLKTRKFSN